MAYKRTWTYAGFMSDQVLIRKPSHVRVACLFLPVSQKQQAAFIQRTD